LTDLDGQLEVGADCARERRSLLVLALVLLLFEANLIAQTGNRPFLPSDETREAAITLELAREGSLAVPRLNHQPFVEKPPLTYVLAVGLSWLVGSTAPGWLRAPQMAAMVGTLLLVFLLGRRMGGTRTGLLSAALLASCGGFLSNGTKLLVDPVLMVFTTGAMVATAWWWLAGGKQRPWLALLAGLSLGMAAAAKGPVAIALHGLAMIGVLLVSGREGLRRLPGLAGISLVSLMPLALWTAELAREGGVALAREALVRNSWGRFARAELGHAEPVWFYLRILPATLLPWTLIAAAGVVAAVRQSRSGGDGERRALLALLLGWSLGGLLLLTASSAKRTLYLLPILPAFALLGGWWLGSVTSAAGAGLMRFMAAALGLAGLAAGVYSVSQGWWLAMLVVPASLWVLSLCWHDRLARLPARGAPALLIATLLASLILVPSFLVKEDEAADLHAAFARIRDEAGRADRVLGVGLTERSRGLVCLALARDFDEVLDEADLRRETALTQGRTLLICDGGARPDLEAHLPASVRLQSAIDLETSPKRPLFLLMVAPGTDAPSPDAGG
jgi:4-amino-4-deoxy-L-arabinose transferase-like glycosyltransferase